jgi:serine/threonine protein kinase
MLGLINRDQANAAKSDAEDGTPDALIRSLLRKGLLTSWQIDRLQKGDPSGFFYGGFKVLFHIAEGTFARVYRGQMVAGTQPVAIKVLRQRFATDPGAVERFNKEAEAGLKLQHPNIVRIHDFGEQDKRHYMIMEFVEGSNLRDFLKLRVRLRPGEALPLMLGLARGLQYALEKGVTHRDIKGTNILISSSGMAKLVDFGLATIEGDEKRMAIAHGQRTVDYSALERTCGSPKGDPRSDIYFLGLVYYQMLTGQLPMPEVESKDPLAKMLKRSFGAIKPLSEQRHAPDEELTRIIEKMMKVELKARYQDISEVVHDLEVYEARPQPSPTALKPPPPPPVEEPVLNPFVAEDEDQSENEHELEDEDATTFRPESFEVRSFQPKNVLCVESQPEIQEAFRRTLSAMGYRVLLVGDAERAAERYCESPPDAVIFDADGLGPEALAALIDMHNKAHEDGHELAALVLLGPRQQALQELLPGDDRLIVLFKPIKMKPVQDAILQLAPLG